MHEDYRSSGPNGRLAHAKDPKTARGKLFRGAPEHSAQFRVKRFGGFTE
jgi:hypothetical protein